MKMKNETITQLFVINFIPIHPNQTDFPSIKINFARLIFAQIIHTNYMVSNKKEISSNQQIYLNSNLGLAALTY